MTPPPAPVVLHAYLSNSDRSMSLGPLNWPVQPKRVEIAAATGPSTPGVKTRGRATQTPNRDKKGAGAGRSLSPAVELAGPTFEMVMPPRGMKPFIRILELCQDDKRFKQLFTKHAGKTPVFKKRQWCHPRSFYVRNRL